MTLYNPNNLIGNPKLDAKVAEIEDAGFIAGDNYLYAASTTEMTGLTPTIAHNEHEAQNYEEIYPYLPPVPHSTEGIHAEYRTEVTPQFKHQNEKPYDTL